MKIHPRGGRRPAARALPHAAPAPVIEPIGRTPHARPTSPPPAIEPMGRPADAWPVWTDFQVWCAPLIEEGGSDVR